MVSFRWFALDSVATGLKWLRGGLKPAPYGFSYARNASAKVLIYALPFFLIPDQIVWMLFVPPHYAYLRPLFIVFDIYMMLSLAGIVATFDELPHTIDGDLVTLRQGILKCVRFDRRDILQTAVIGTGVDKSTMKSQAGKDAVYLRTSGAPTVKLTLRAPVEVHMIGGRTRLTDVIFVSVDDPSLFLSALKAAA